MTEKPECLQSERSISVVVPVYGSALILPALYSRIRDVLDALTSNWELVMVDDASPDDSWQVLNGLRSADPRVKIILLATNHGQQLATLCGIGFSHKQFVVTLDDDLQCYPEDIPRFIEVLETGRHVVIGRIADGRKRHQWWRNIGSKVNQWIAGKVLGKPKHLSLSSYRAFTRHVADRLVSYKGAHAHIAALLLKSVPASHIANVSIQHSLRADGGASSYSLSKLIKTLSFLVINHSFFPLRFMVAWGVFVSVTSLGFAAWVVLRMFFGGAAILGWPSLAVLVSFLCGNILLALGIIGEYLGRLVSENNKYAQFSVFDVKI